MSDRKRRVVITGVGLVSPLGTGREKTWSGLLKGEAGIAPITLFNTAGFSCRIAGEVKDFDPQQFIERKDFKKMARFIQFALAAAAGAMEQAGLDMQAEDRDRVGVYVGSGIGGFEIIEREHTKLNASGPDRVSPFFITASIANLAAGQISIRYGAAGPNLAVATACSTGAHAIGESFRMIDRGDADVMLCGGAEACVTPLAIAGFAAMRALSTRNEDPATASRPFSLGRDGFVVGEGAGVLVLEELEHARKRGATILAEIVGYAANSDAFHPNAPPEDGRGIQKVMQLALHNAKLNPSQVQYVNAHATSTPLGDRAEAHALREVFGDAVQHLLVSSTKSMTGHLLGGAGSLEAGITVLALRDQIAPPTTNVQDVEPECRFRLVRDKGLAAPIEYAMSNSFGFGGTNASLIFRRFIA